MEISFFFCEDLWSLCRNVDVLLRGQGIYHPWLRTSRNFCFHLQTNDWKPYECLGCVDFPLDWKERSDFQVPAISFQGGYRYDSSYLTSHFTPKVVV